LFEEHLVQTTDGYILGLHRIPPKQGLNIINSSISERKTYQLAVEFEIKTTSFDHKISKGQQVKAPDFIFINCR